MTLSESIFSALVAGSPNTRVYPDLLPQNPLLPASVYTAIFLDNEEDLAGNDCGLVNAHVQIDSYALTRAAADGLADFVRDQILAAGDLQVRTVGGFWAYEDDTKRYRTMREYSIWKNT